ncbi:PQQ-binding-like beta-propeller repeat protein [Hymenobacter sp. HDW8]|uniref:outer membrane protein assembly factor BamB family protein n=1 Tax=Hymenobacter sp. HDW8 TaxID=2714932 RepID=UPI00140BF1F6|nr:PQQ-binding-like beta-propeller repeat protein [Hymenobacter sp. HDW8]QIL77653.1 PQQ-binding-like beta-propeller repeat protein [Hymenobacter sp. HDW8]
MKQTCTRLLALAISLAFLETTSVPAVAQDTPPPSAVSDQVTEAWAVHYNSTIQPRDDRAVAVTVDGEGNVIVTGYVYRSQGRFNPNYDIVTIKYAPSGQPLWTTRSQNTFNYDERPKKMVVDAAGNVYVTGTYATTGTSLGYLTVKYDGATGETLWVVRRSGGTPVGLALDGAGHVVVTGSYYSGSLESTNWATVKYDGATGQQLWERQYNGPGSLVDNAVALAVDASNNVVVTGTIGTPSISTDFMTLKYDGATGQQLWATAYNSAASREDRATAVALDALGNVFVTGSTDVEQSRDIVTVKYEAATGQQVWTVRYGGPAQKSDEPAALAIDGAGNVIVAGESQEAQLSTSALVLKYTPTGEPLWEGRYTRPTNPSSSGVFDGAEALALDAAGNVYIVGTSITNIVLNPADYRTIKFAATTGEQLWNAAYDGPAPVPGTSTDQAAPSIAVDKAGNVLVTGNTSSSGAITTVKYTQTREVPLPVELISFVASPRGADVRLRWVTAQEQNNQYFELEVSVDGVRFQPLHRTPGQGTTTQRHTYEYIDKNAPRYGQSVIYYRLKQVDLDGTLTYSAIQAVPIATSAAFTVQAWPNPLGEQLSVQINSPEAGEATLHLVNALGQVMLQKRAFLEVGTNTLVLPMNRTWPAGVYSLQLRQGAVQRTLKLLQN